MKNTARTTDNIWSRFAVGLVLVALIWIVFGQTLTFDFVNYDDKTYVYGNSLVSAGLSLHGLSRAFVDTQTTNWHPLTIISHMTDCQFYDLKAGGHHFTNVLLHTISALLLFAWLRNLTGNFWSAAFVAALFAIHPLHVESVAWIAERKDVLSAVFFFLTLLAYAHYLRSRTSGRYVMMSILFACGLMSKPMVVTLPVVLILLDYWPFNRITDLRSFWKVTVEKIPLFALALASSIVTFVLQEHSAQAVAQLPFSWRVENALVTSVTYIWQVFWPVDLSVFYPHPEDTLAWWQLVGAALLLIAITCIVFVLRRTRPYLLFGWLWYLIMLLPVIGIIEVGLQGHADRYTYLPHIGLYIALTRLIADVLRSLQRRKQILFPVAGVVVAALTACSWKQTTYWRNSETLWSHALGVTQGNDVALTNFATMLADRGQFNDALSYFQRALAVHASSKYSHYNLSLALIYNSTARALAQLGRVDEAMDYFSRSIACRSDYADSHYNLGVILFEKGDVDGAIGQWRATLAINPTDFGTHIALAGALLRRGLLRDALEEYEKALQSEPDSAIALNNIAWIRSTSSDDGLRNAALAVQLAEKANRVSKQENPFFVRTLAAAYAEAGEFDKAIEAAQTAAGLAHAQGEHGLARNIEREIGLYQRHEPFRDPTVRNAR